MNHCNVVPDFPDTFPSFLRLLGLCMKSGEGVVLLAAALEQLGYQAASATWRNAYLQGAQELRHGLRENQGSLISFDLTQALDANNLFDALAIRLNSQRAAGKRITINWYFTDIQKEHLLTLERATINHLSGYKSHKPDLSVRLTQATLRALLLKQTNFARAKIAGLIKINGNSLKLIEFFSLFDEVNSFFPIVTPRPSLPSPSSGLSLIRTLVNKVNGKSAKI